MWGLPCPPHYCAGGALLPHLFTLTPASLSGLCHPEASVFCSPKDLGAPREASRCLRRNNRAFGAPPLQSPYNDAGAVCFLWHFPSIRLKPDVPDVIRHTALRSSDFPLSRPKAHQRPSGPAAYASIISDTGLSASRSLTVAFLKDKSMNHEGHEGTRRDCVAAPFLRVPSCPLWL